MTRCLAPDCQMGGLGCDNMTVVLVCFLHGKPYDDLAARCSVPAAARGRLHSTGSSGSSSPRTSCSNTTPETSDEEIAHAEQTAQSTPEAGAPAEPSDESGQTPGTQSSPSEAVADDQPPSKDPKD